MSLFVDTFFEKANEDFWNNKILPALRRSHYLIVISTPDAFRPRSDGTPNWVCREIDTFLDLNGTDGPKRVIVALGPGAPEDMFPGKLDEVSKNWDWADLRPLSCRRFFSPSDWNIVDDSFTKIAATIYDVPEALLPALRREEGRRRALVFHAAAAALLIVLSALSGLTWWALEERAEAEHQRQQAESRELAARAQLELMSDDPTSALRLAIEAGGRAETFEADAALRSALQRSHVKAILRHDGIMEAAFNGELVATAGTDGTVRVWDAEPPALLHTLRETPNDQAFDRLAFSPDGRKIAAGGRRGKIEIWDAKSGKKYPPLIGHHRSITHIGFDKSGRKLISASLDGSARVWDVETGATLTNLDRHSGTPVRHAAFSPDERRIVTSAIDLHAAFVWDLETRERIARLETGGPVVWAEYGAGNTIVTATRGVGAAIWDVGDADAGDRADVRTDRFKSIPMTGHQGGVRHAAVRGSIVTAGEDGTSRIWKADYYTGEWSEIDVLLGHEAAVNHVAFSPDGRRLVTASDDGTARLWEKKPTDWGITPEAWREIATLAGHKGAVRRANFAPDGEEIVTVGEDGTARIWDVMEDREVAVLRGHSEAVEYAAFSRDGGWVVTTGGSSDGAWLWDARTGRHAKTFGGFSLYGPTLVVNHADFSPEGTRIVTADSDHVARIWNLSTSLDPIQLQGHKDSVEYAVFGPDGRRVLTASSDSTARIWDPDTGVSEVLEGHTQRLWGASFSPSGDRVLTTSWDGTARIWSIGDGGKPIVLEKGGMHAFFSPDGKRIVTVDRGTARVWDAASGTQLPPISAGNAHILHAAFSPKGEAHTLAAALDDATVRVWDDSDSLSTEPRILRGHRGKVEHVAFSPDGSRLLTASADGTGRIWDIEKGVLLATLVGHDGPVTYAAFSHDGRQVVTTSQDHTARVYFTHIADLVDLAKSRLPADPNVN